MKIFVVGASGRVAKEVISLLAKRGNIVTAGCRHPELVPEEKNVEPVAFDLHQPAAGMVPMLKGQDAVYFVAGSRGKDLLQTDAFGAVKLMQAAKEAGVQRFIMLSSMFSLQPEKWAEEPGLASITNYNIAKFFADEWLIHNSGLNYTIVQPTALVEEPGTGRIELNPEHTGTNPIPDVALVLADVLDMPNTYGKVIMLRSGDVPVEEALAEV